MRISAGGRRRSSKDALDRLQKALIYEGEQAWLHHRHVENERNQYLGFFFTIVLAVLGLLVTTAAKVEKLNGALILGAGMMLLLLFALSMVMHLSMQRLGAVLRYYDHQIELIRRELFRDYIEEHTHLVAERLAKWETGRHSNRRQYGIQRATTLITVSTGWLCWFGQIGLASYASLTEATTLVVVGSWAFPLLSVTGLLGGFLLMGRQVPQRDRPARTPDGHTSGP